MQFPRMLYRRNPDGHVMLDTGRFETITAHDEDEREVALLEGWIEADDALKRHPLDHDGDGKAGGSPAGENATRRRGRKPKA